MNGAVALQRLLIRRRPVIGWRGRRRCHIADPRDMASRADVTSRFSMVSGRYGEVLMSLKGRLQTLRARPAAIGQEQTSAALSQISPNWSFGVSALRKVAKLLTTLSAPGRAAKPCSEYCCEAPSGMDHIGRAQDRYRAVGKLVRAIQPLCYFRHPTRRPRR